MPKLHWIGRDQVVQHHRDVPVRALDFQYRFAAPTEALGNSHENRIIHGDNLDALKSLLPEFEGRVNCIYIDPPYNTGNEGWVYNDAMNDPKMKRWLGQVVGKEGEDLTRHDKWLCMMYPRLKLLHRLLADDGVIFVSIDDEEVTHLRLIMNEVFTSSSFIGQFVWKSRQNKDNRTKTGASIDHEYVLCYGNKIRGDERDLSQYSNPDNDLRGLWTSGNMVGLASKEARPNLHYELVDPQTNIGYGCPTQGWRFDQARMASLIAEKRILWPVNPEGRPRQKVFLDEMSTEFTGFSSILDFDLYTYHGTREIESIFGTRIFDFPKSSDVVLKLIEQAATSPDAIILDSFAGSGTTAHAVLKLNAQDGGHRRFILVETMDYAETITAERVRRVIRGYGEGAKAVAGLGGGFDFYRVGERLFDELGHLNPAAPLANIRAYIAWQEGLRLNALTTPSAQPNAEPNPDQSPYWLGTAHDSARYFCYQPNEVVTLDFELLASLKITSQRSVIYADVCTLGPQFMAQRKITFKKIPRDIAKL
jgi:adenine-specific DNA-methyltransferase